MPFSHPASQSVRERRGARRARLATLVTITVGGSLIHAVGADVSQGGIRLVSDRQVNVGEQASLVFFLQGDIVSATGTVRWCAPTPRGLFTFGVSFAVLEEDAPVLLATYCRAVPS
jgi:hypothetical protein